VLSLAAESTLTQEHDSLTAEAKHLLLLIEQCLGEFNTSHFVKLYFQVRYWSGFVKNQTDRELRAVEFQSLMSVLSMASDEASISILEKVLPGSASDFGASGEEIRVAIFSEVASKAAKETVSLFRRHGGVRALFEANR